MTLSKNNYTKIVQILYFLKHKWYNVTKKMIVSSAIQKIVVEQSAALKNRRGKYEKNYS